MKTKNRKGFTLIELLIVVVIIGILAAIAIPKFANTKEKAYIASMKSDLRNLATAQESYFADYLTYGGTYGTGAGQVQFQSSQGVTVTPVAQSGLGWSASATHTGTTQTCNIFAGNLVVGTSKDGVPECA
jgi:type IV pilus assembly protein PilA